MYRENLRNEESNSKKNEEEDQSCVILYKTFLVLKWYVCVYPWMYNEFEWMVCKEVRSIASNMSLLSIKVRKRRESERKEKGYLILYHYRLMLFTRLLIHSAY